ncbi:MAG: TIGR01777 family oxidoreductase [Planctomycetales bacterium]|nr:TIGR01777 family oxidoreductase [Planctomycetales bacterium]
MKICMTGASGLVGEATMALLRSQGHDVHALVRRTPSSGEIAWDPDRDQIDLAGVAGAEAIVHLAGENIAKGRWTDEKKARIRHSRVHGTRFLVRSLLEMEQPPRTLVCASAIGYYGDRGDEVLNELSGPGTGFLSDICREWEQASELATDAGLRVVRLRIGVVLSKRGGALAKMLLPFRLGLGGRVGSGQQYWSWISLTDLARAIAFVLTNDEIQGAVNAVAPQPLRNSEFTNVLGSVLKRPTIFPMPAFAAKLALGEMGEELLLASTQVIPARLQETGFAFEHADLESALAAELAK